MDFGSIFGVCLIKMDTQSENHFFNMIPVRGPQTVSHIPFRVLTHGVLCLGYSCSETQFGTADLREPPVTEKGSPDDLSYSCSKTQSETGGPREPPVQGKGVQTWYLSCDNAYVSECVHML